MHLATYSCSYLGRYIPNDLDSTLSRPTPFPPIAQSPHNAFTQRFLCAARYLSLALQFLHLILCTVHVVWWSA